MKLFIKTKLFAPSRIREEIFIWIGEGPCAEFVAHKDWVRFPSTRSFEEAEEVCFETISATRTHIADFSLEELLTCDNEEIRNWALKQAERV